MNVRLNHRLLILVAFLALAVTGHGGNLTYGQVQKLSVTVSTTASEPAWPGVNMLIEVNVTNQASIPMQVQSVTISLDWHQRLTGITPRVLRAGRSSTWSFDNVTIPSDTWIGNHSFDAYVAVAWADSNGGWSQTLPSPVHTSTSFSVQERPNLLPSWAVLQPFVTVGLLALALLMGLLVVDVAMQRRRKKMRGIHSV